MQKLPLAMMALQPDRRQGDHWRGPVGNSRSSYAFKPIVGFSGGGWRFDDLGGVVSVQVMKRLYVCCDVI